MTVVAVAGGFDPLHVGHVRHIEQAAALGDYLIVICQTDEHLIAKKGYCFMPYGDRREILQALKWVVAVFENVGSQDGGCGHMLRYLNPDIFAKGGDRTPDNMPQEELDVCRELGIKIVYGVGEQVRSSSEIVARLRG